MEEKDNDEQRRPNNPLRHLDLFSGIGGFALGLSWAGGFETVAFCDNEPFAQEILKKRWPNVPIYEDVRTINEKELDSFLTIGFPSPLGLAMIQTRSLLWKAPTPEAGIICGMA